MKKLVLILIALLLPLSCKRARGVRLENSQAPVPALVIRPSPTPDPQLSELNLAEIGALAPKGRVQDTGYNQLPVVENLIAHGKESIPYLIGRLEDETKAKGHVLDYWSDVRVGDVAFIILTDFFTDSTWRRATIPGAGWDEFLGRRKDANVTSEQLFHNYIANHGRKGIQKKWQQMWDENREKVYWDEKERCFKAGGRHLLPTHEQ